MEENKNIIRTENEKILSKDNSMIETIKNGLIAKNSENELNIKKIDLINNSLNKLSNISDNFTESQRIQADTHVIQNMIATEYNKDMEIIHKNFDKQDRMLDNVEKVIDRGLNDNDIEKIKAGLWAGANIANTNPVQDISNKLDRVFDDDDDEFLEI